MPHFQDEQRLSPRTLLLFGVPIFVISVALSVFVHQYAHAVVGRLACEAQSLSPRNVLNLQQNRFGCPTGVLAGPVATFALAVISFALFMRSPRNLFFASMAFINASARIPDAVSAFFSLLVHQKPQAGIDESALVDLLRYQDPTIATVILCFSLLTVICLTLIVVHDTHIIPRKWIVAPVLFAGMLLVQNAVWGILPTLAQ